MTSFTRRMSFSDSENDISLSMECMSSSSDSIISSDVADALPYLYEPNDSSSDIETREEESRGNRGEERLSNTNWCSCGHCMPLPTEAECRCCGEIAAIRDKLEALEDNQPTCITQHPGFSEVCLSPYALETAYYHYRQEYGKGDIQGDEVHRKYRYIAYRQLVRWCWRYLGRTVRVPLPACAVLKIRERFPSADYIGFKLPILG